MFDYITKILPFINLFIIICLMWYVGVGRADETEPVTVIEEPTSGVEEVPNIIEGVPDVIPNVIEELGKFKLTAYCPCTKCCGKNDGITASGVKATANRTIAVDPSKIPYGTELIINGNTYIAEDCGGAIKGNTIDIYFDSHQEALNFGVQYNEVYRVG